MWETKNNILETNTKNSRQYKTNKFFLHIILWSIVSSIIITFISAIIYGITGKKFSKDIEDFLVTLIGLWIPSILYLFRMKKEHNVVIKDVLRLNKVSFKNLGYSFILYLCATPLIALVAIISSLMFSSATNIITDYLDNASLLNNILQTVFMAGIGEEIIFRGIILDGYKENKSLLVIILANGLFFGLFHHNLFQFGYATLMGILFSIICIYTNSIFPSIIIHGLHNALSIFDIELFWFLDYFSDSIALLVLSLLTIVGLFVFVFVLKKFKLANIQNFKAPEAPLDKPSFKLKNFLKMNWPIFIIIFSNIIMSLIIINM